MRATLAYVTPPRYGPPDRTGHSYHLLATKGPVPDAYRNRIFTRSPESLLPVQDGSVHCVVTAPPFRSRGSYSAALDRYVDQLASVGRELHRVLRDDGRLWLVLGHAAARAASYNPRGD